MPRDSNSHHSTHRSRAFRIFTCDECGHKMRLRGAHCGYCYADKNRWQRPGTYVALLVIVVLITLMALVT
ncbi:hypothetical protein [Tranquillimonas alkanivorans]|uniref:Uncharacterized protein n=1 Tax=Tranquillimonas alkanivorans TaxID=441119 RepID=A0A1I5P1R3_9RHOB|nr:hypothetical protein [Tranquillimonas alkanivorans]SFP28004.1 hypothetical protein SAMN04488047_104195 [Tranquillimonas alkanivorans]